LRAPKRFIRSRWPISCDDYNRVRTHTRRRDGSEHFFVSLALALLVLAQAVEDRLLVLLRFGQHLDDGLREIARDLRRGVLRCGSDVRLYRPGESGQSGLRISSLRQFAERFRERGVLAPCGIELLRDNRRQHFREASLKEEKDAAHLVRLAPFLQRRGAQPPYGRAREAQEHTCREGLAHP
jgi:hypothetical protein